MSRRDGRIVDEEFLKSDFQYEDKDYIEELKKFHWSLFHLYGIDENNTIKEKNTAENQRKLFRNSLQDETVRRLHRFMDESVRIAGGELNIFSRLLDPELTDRYDILTKEDVKNLFTRKFSWPWRDIDIWIKFPEDNKSGDNDDDDDGSDYGWFHKVKKEPYLSIEVTDWVGDHEDEFYFTVPLKYLMKSTMDNLESNGEFQKALQEAGVEHKYNVLFGHHDLESKKKILELVDKAGLTKQITDIKEKEDGVHK